MNRLRGSPSIIVFLFYFACLWTSSCLAMCPTKCNCNDEALRVNCSDADLNVIPITLNPGLQQFHLRNNHIKAIKSSFGVYHNLQYLDMSQNVLDTVGKDSFVKQSQLKILLLGRNLISSLQNDSFKGLGALQILQLNANQLEAIDGSVFWPLRALETLDVSRNRLYSIADDAFVNLTSLKTLLLRDNQLRTIPSSSLSRVPALLKLDLGFNPFSDVAEGALSPMEQLESLDLDQCGLAALRRGSFEGLKSLLVLNLRDNKLTRVPTDALSDAPRLEELDAGQNMFLEIGPRAFKGSKYLKTVVVRGSKALYAVRAGAFEDNPNLEDVAFERNSELRVVEPGVFDGLPNLRRVSLRGNGLENVDQFLLPWDELEFLDLRDNPLVCNCSLSWLRTLLRKTNVSAATEYLRQPETPEETSSVVCVEPETVRGRLVSDLTAEDFNCEPDDSRKEIIIGLVIGVCLIVIGLAMVAFRFRERIAGVLKTKWNGNRKEPQYQKTNGEEENNILQAAQHPLKNTPVTEL